MIQFGEEHLNDRIKIDYFAVSLPNLLVFDADLQARNRTHCLYLMGLGHLGLGNGHTDGAIGYLEQVLTLDSNHQGAALHKKMVDLLTAPTVAG